MHQKKNFFFKSDIICVSSPGNCCVFAFLYVEVCLIELEMLKEMELYWGEIIAINLESRVSVHMNVFNVTTTAEFNCSSNTTLSDM